MVKQLSGTRDINAAECWAHVTATTGVTDVLASDASYSPRR